MSAWIEGDILFEKDYNKERIYCLNIEGVRRFHRVIYGWAESNCKRAVKLVTTEHEESVHVTLLFHGHPASEEFMRAVKPFDLNNVELHGTIDRVVIAQKGKMILLHLRCMEICELFEKVYQAVHSGTGVEPMHTLFDGDKFYKRFAPHITLAYYNNDADTEQDFADLRSDVFLGQQVVIRNFTVCQDVEGGGGGTSNVTQILTDGHPDLGPLC